MVFMHREGKKPAHESRPPASAPGLNPDAVDTGSSNDKYLPVPRRLIRDEEDEEDKVEGKGERGGKRE